MLGLDSYPSSDEEGESHVTTTSASDPTPTAPQRLQHGNADLYVLEKSRNSRNGPFEGEAEDRPRFGPAPGPVNTLPDTATGEDGSPSAPASPYSRSQLLLRNLTMPPVPNFDIPDSPPGSPPPSPTAKFARFLELKKQGVHFNTKLEQSSALRNPNLLQKLMDFAGFDEQDQYASTLPPGLAVPTAFPPWAYAEELNKSQQGILKKSEEDKARGQRQAIEFASATVSAGSSRRSTPGASDRSAGRSGTERVVAGLSRNKSASASAQDAARLGVPERRRPRSRFDVVGSSDGSRSRSPRPRDQS